MKNYLFLLVITTLFFSINSNAQKDKIDFQNISFRKVARISIPVKSVKFQSNETKNAREDYLSMTKSGQPSKTAISSLRKKGHSNSAILATVRQIHPRFTSSSVSNTEVSEDAQLMLKAIPTLTAAEVITAIRDLYDVNATKLFDIAILTLQDSTVRVGETKGFTFRCDLKIYNPDNVGPGYPFRKTETKLNYGSYYKKLYPWECFDYWNTGFRSVILPETNLNNYLRSMRLSSYPLYGGMTSADLSDPLIDFKVIMGNTAESLAELMECAGLPYFPGVANTCDMEVPTQPATGWTGDSRYTGSCKHASVIKHRFNVKDVLPVLKRNGFLTTVLATAMKTRFNPTDADLKQKIVASFDTAVFTTAEILQVSNVINSN